MTYDLLRRPSRRNRRRLWAPLLALSAAAWLLVLGDGGAAAGLMGLTAAQYVAGWLAMTAAMMLPSLAWFASV